MRKTITLFLFLLAITVQVFAQDRTVTGTVTSAQDKLGIPGVSVVEPGTTNGAVTDIDGKFSVTVKATTTQLKFSGTGLVTQTVDIPASNTISITMQQDVQKLGEVVVTALGIKREEKSLGYATQQIKGKEVSLAKETNFINSLQGKVAGVTITGSSNLGGSSRILLRGVRSINFENQPLFIVDGVPVNNGNFSDRNQVRGALGYDYGNAAQDINPDDIENINILKGSAASALYGSQGANGVVIITTKKGAPRISTTDGNRLPIGVSVTTGMTFSKVAVLPKYQNRYGGGAAPEFIPSTEFPEFDANGDPIPNRSNFEYDGSWGPEMNGQEVYQWNSYYESLLSFGKKLPWNSNPDNVKDFFETGVTTNNNIAIEGGSDVIQYRLSYTNYDSKGTVPNSKINRNIVSLNMTYNVTDRLSSTTSLNYIAARGKGRAQTGYSNLASNFTQWWQRQLNINDLKDYKNPDGTQRTWNMNSETDLSPLYWDNPYWTCYENYQTDQRNRIYGGTTLSYQIFKDITISGSARTDYYNDNRQERVAVGSSSTSKYSEQAITFNENNYELMLTGKRALSEKFDINFTLGTNRQDRKTINEKISTQGGLNIANFYSLSNSKSELLYDPSVGVNRIQLRRNSIFAAASFGFNKFIYVDVTGRNDWSSTLPPDNNSYFYPSVTGSFVFSELIKASWFSFGKIRAGWSQTAIDPQPYSYGENRPTVTPNFLQQATAIIGATSNNPDLRPEKTSAFEVGADLDFFKRRVSLDIAYSSSISKDVIFAVQQSAATGYGFTNYNAAEISNKGIEISLNLIPVKMASGLEWGIGANFAKNKNIVEKLYTDPNGKETESLLLENAPFAVRLEARPGMSYGQIVGYDYVYDENGNKLVDPASGAYVRTSKIKPLGSILPDFTGGFSTYVQYKGIRLAATIDYQKGGKLFSLTNTWGKYSGTLEETAEGNIREDGIVNEGVLASETEFDEDGNPLGTGVQNDINLAAVDHFFLDGGYVIGAADVYDASFVKFRELTLTYDLPEKWFKKTIQGISISLTGRNLAILSKNVPNIDPESAVSANNVQGLEGGQMPTERMMGFSVNFRF